jgi:hypothetical protein
MSLRPSVLVYVYKDWGCTAHRHNVCMGGEGKETGERKKYEFLGFLMIGWG